MVGLIDCNNFFVSCERVFNPGLMRKPVIVLSNNDGCAVALSEEAKALGIKRGDPYFKIRHICDSNLVTVYSGNHKLYSDMSSRVMATLASLTSNIEVYSVDEAFFDLGNMTDGHIEDKGRFIVKKIRRDTGIPTSMGIAHTKTLAKIAARFAKRYHGYRCVCLIDDDNKRRKALSLTPIENVWGIGRKLGKKLPATGVMTALDFADIPYSTIHKEFNITTERTWRELNGEPCVDMTPEETEKKQICCSRSFGEMIKTLDGLTKAIATFTTIAARKLRKQNSCASAISVFIQSNRFRNDMEQYSNSAIRIMEESTADTSMLLNAAIKALESIFRHGISYKRAGVILSGIVNDTLVQPSLFISQDKRERRNNLMKIIDTINASSATHDTIHIASYEPVTQLSRHEHSSRLYTTSIKDVIKIK